uniref:Alsin Rho guanine nucleotide exchange factor ALS2 n=1 Tax=Cyprinodon variegatus TaxID=28743 RepID=A0A3Q2D4F0_CYPVA
RAPGRGLLHVWPSGEGTDQLFPETAFLSRPVVQVSLGEHHGMLLLQGGEVFSFGELSWRGLSVPVSAPLLEASLLERVVVHVAAGGFHCGAISEQGSVYMWGENAAGQCGQTEDGSVPCPVTVVDSEVIPPVVVRVVGLACGLEHSLALSDHHELWAWGSGCQLGLVTKTFPVCKPQKVEHLAGRRVIQVACGAYHSLALVHSLPAQDIGTQSTPKMRERGRSPQCPVIDREEVFTADDAHYCPLGVELSEVMRSEVNTPLLFSVRALLLVCAQIPHARINTLIFDLVFCSGGASGPLSSSPVSLEEVRLCLVKEKQALLSSSLTNIHQKGNAATSRRLSLPGIPTHGSPRRRHHCACGPTPAAQAPSAGPDDARDGLPSLETEVWSWGRGSEGQLGHGDQLARLQPLCIKSLTGQEVIKVAAGSHHSLALTAQCQVYSWGSNMCGQLGHVKTPVTVPQLAKLSDGLRVWDVSAGQSHSLLLADGDCVQPVLLYCGQKSGKQQNRSFSQSSPTGGESYAVRPSLLPFYIEMSYISSVCSGGQLCAALTDRNVMGFIAAIHELASSERRFSCWTSDVRKFLIAPLRKKGESSSTLGEPSARLFFALCDSFVHLSKLVGRHATSLSYFLQNAQSRDVASFPLLTNTETFMETYCMLYSLFSLEALASQQAVLAQLCGSDESVSGKLDLVSMFYQPLQQLHHYNRVLLKMAACYDVLTMEYQSLQQGCSHFEALSLSLLRKKKEAENTQLFWKTHSGKTIENLRLPQRRVVCESNNRSLTPQNAGRFSNHWFILFNDALVHSQFSTHHVYPLTCLWVKPITEDRSGVYAIRIICPEESFTLVASTPQEKNKWLRALNQAVDQVLGGAAQGSSPGVTVAVCRTASYKFIADERFKEAEYSGSWMAGRVHGRGTMKWPDGRMYKGNFKNGLEDGYGECVIPNKVQNKHDAYQGQWREGKIHGFGKYRYASGEVYEGCFCDGQRHGYGMLSSSKLARTSSSVFIGHWVQDRKTGYGVHDDITRGEKYMGFWLDDQRHGSAVVVTQYGLYFEGSFKENRMSGSGLLVSDDDTVFHGEFSDDWTINGKGVMTLANGDNLDGLFSGEWRTGLKVAGTYVKPTLEEYESKEKNVLLGQYVVPAAQRWICVFDECWSRLGCNGAGEGERSKAWENIAVTITTARRQSPDLSKSHTKVLESLEFIPHYGEPVTTTNYDNIRRYLTKACETPHHPLGWLVETLVTAYRMTYVGVGSNRRLLQQAVQELQAYLTHFYTIIRFLFPGLPGDGGIIPDPPHPDPFKGRRNSDKVEQGCSSLLLPLLLPRLYPPLFTLYCLQQEQEEAQYWERILRLNKQPDQSLLGFLGVQEKFWPHWMSILGEKKQIVSSSKDACFVSAVETLQQISTTFTPSDKLMVIQRTFEELTLEVKPLLAGDFLWCMDDLFPLFLYVVLRARIRNLGAEVSLIEDLMDPNLQHGETGLMFTTLKACFIQIQQESTL